MEQHRPDPSRRRAHLGIVTGVIAASLLGAGAVAAQSPSPSPSAGGAPVTQPAPTASPRHPSKNGNGNGGMRGYGRQGMGPNMGPNMGQWPGDGRRGMGPDQDQGMGPNMGPDMGQWPGDGRRGMGPDQDQGMGPNMGQRGYRGGFGRGDGPMVQGGRLPWLMGRSAVTVTAITAPVISLATDDGWSRDIDTTNVVITRDGQAITLADVSVGDAVRVAQTRNADGTWTVTGIEVQPASVLGTVASVGTDSFTVTASDGTVVTVRVSDTTRWMTRRGTTTGLASLTVGSAVVAVGVRAADGSIDATAVGVRGVQPTQPNQPTTPGASPSPGASQG